MTAQDNEQNKQPKPVTYQSKGRGQTRNIFYDNHNYNQRNKHRYGSDSRDRRILFSGRIQCGQDYTNRPRYEQNYRNAIRRSELRGNVRQNQMYREQNY